MNRANRRRELENLIETGSLAADFDVEKELDLLDKQDNDTRRLATYREIRDAYGRSGPKPGTRWASPIQTAALAQLVIRWTEGRESAALDDALEYCYGQDLPVLRALLRHVVGAVRDRRSKGKSPLSPAMRFGIKDAAFTQIANLICVGFTLERACEVATVQLAHSSHPLKASTLEKDYPKVWRKGQPSLEDELREHRKILPNPAQDEVWREIERQTPLPTPEQKGGRR